MTCQLSAYPLLATAVFIRDMYIKMRNYGFVMNLAVWAILIWMALKKVFVNVYFVVYKKIRLKYYGKINFKLEGEYMHASQNIQNKRSPLLAILPPAVRFSFQKRSDVLKH